MSTTPRAKPDEQQKRQTQSRKMRFSAKAGNVDQIRTCIAKGGDMEGVDASGMTPLMLACAAGRVEAAAELARQGANPNAQQLETGATPLMFAVSVGNWDLVKVLSPVSDHGLRGRCRTLGEGEPWLPEIYPTAFGWAVQKWRRAVPGVDHAEVIEKIALDLMARAPAEAWDLQDAWGRSPRVLCKLLRHMGGGRAWLEAQELAASLGAGAERAGRAASRLSL